MANYKPQVRLIKYLDEAPRVIASAGKLTISGKEFSNIIEDMSDEKIEEWIKELIRRGHGSPLEHSLYVFEVACSRVTSHQIVRHRIASYTQLSQRFSDKYFRNLIEKTASYIGTRQPVNRKNTETYKQYTLILEKLLASNPDFETLLDIVGEAFIIPPQIITRRNKLFLEKLVESVKLYYRLLAEGVKYEDARFILPQAVKTRLLISMNARELIESFLPLRMCTHAQWEIRYIAWSLWKKLMHIHPQLFKYVGPRCILYDNRCRKTPCTIKKYLSGECKPSIERCPELVPREGIIPCLHFASKDPWRAESLSSKNS